MDPCPFVRIFVGNLALKIPVASKPARSGVHPSSAPCYCKIRFKNFPLQTAIVPLVTPENQYPDGQSQTLAASFHLSKADLDKLAVKSIFAGKVCLKISIYTGRRGSTCGVNSGRLLGRVSVPLDLEGTESRSCVFHNGWISVGKDEKGSSSQLHLSVRSEPDPRFVFQFDGEPECSPQVFQIQGNIRQPVFTCKFSFRNYGDRSQMSRSSQLEASSSISWLSSLGSDREKLAKERKGWSITVHDLSGSPVALASMVTPFVASPGTDRVSRSNPGAWLILRPGDGTWKPWGRLEAWRERGSSDGLGYRFELLPDTNGCGMSAAGVSLAESTIGMKKGGKFVIDTSSNSNGNSSSPACSPRSSGDFGYGLWPYCMYRGGFVMSSTVEREGRSSKPAVEVGVQHVNCTEDAAAFVALAAAVDLSRDITFDELMSKMRELFEGAALLKYQQPDEDLDALVSVVNDDDVTNMMEEYDKLGSGDGFTRLRIFLFSQPDQDAASLFNTGESETERRYVDALNSLNDAPDFRKLQPSESPVMGPMDKVPAVDQFFNPMTLEASVHNQRNYEIPLQQFNLQHLKIPCIGSGQAQQSHGQRYNDMEAPWSPAYYSPGHHGHHDNRHMAEFPSSPSSGRYRMQFGEISDKCFDRMSEEFGRQHVNHLHPYEQQPAFVDNVVWLPPGALPGDKAGFPGNLGHSPGVFESNSICEYCRKTFQRNQPLSEASNYSETRWKHGGQPHLEQPNTGGEFHQFSNPCAECNPSREAYMLNPDVKLDHGIYSKEQTEHHTFYNEVQNHDRGWIVHQLHNRTDETRAHNSGAGRVNEQYMVDGTGMTIPLVHGNCCNGHQLHSNYISHEDQRHFQPTTEMGNEGFHDQAVGSGLHVHIPTVDDHGVQYGNFPSPHGADNFYQLSQGHAHGHAFWRKLQNPMHGAPSYDPSSNIQPQANGTINPGFLWGTRDGSPRYCIGVDGQNTWGGPSQKILGFDGSSIPEYFHGHAQKLSSNTLGPESQHSFAPDPIGSPPDMRDFTTSKEPVLLPSSSLIDARMVCSSTPGCDLGEAVIFSERNMLGEDKVVKQVEAIDDSDARSLSYAEKNGKADRNYDEPSFNSNAHSPIEEGADIAMLGASDARVMPDDGGLTVKHLNFLPELIASVKKAAIYGVEEVKSKVQGNANRDLSHDLDTKEVAFPDSESVNANVDLEVDSDSDHPDSSSIEPTKAEEDALAKGLQTIKNDDLEEIRELGSGTYGSVFHGKWKGSDVAIKRIKASCFAGRPSERERLIADFWKEALILSSLHHPNVVSFYGIVRDGPDGSLATVTEFMINGSLKQFLQKKDRTIDRRKRLIIAMDAAIGMEYLHGKNIVHFDLKCENLLVNMRDPHRPVCKIGDLGLSKVKQHTLVSGGVRGTLPWMAPELLSGKSNMVSEKIDVYSFGIVMWELLTGDEPYADMHCASIIGGIVNNSLRPQVPTWCDPEWKSLMESCWASDPGERPSFAEISQKLRKMAAAINVK